MKYKILTSMTMFLLLATAASALTLDGSCDIQFFGQSTLHSFDGQVACQPFTLNSEGETEGYGVIRQPVITVLVGEMDTDNSSRDKKMHAMFEQDKYPQIQGLFAELDPEAILQQLHAVDETQGQLEFDLRIREINQSASTICDSRSGRHCGADFVYNGIHTFSDQLPTASTQCPRLH